MEKINPDKYYSASKIVKNGWLWMKSPMTFFALLKRKEGLETFKPIVLSKGKYTYYKIKGSILIEVLGKINKGKLEINE